MAPDFCGAGPACAAAVFCCCTDCSCSSSEDPDASSPLPGLDSDDDDEGGGGGIRKRGTMPGRSHGRGGTIIGGCTQTNSQAIIKEGHTPKKRRRGAHLAFIGR